MPSYYPDMKEQFRIMASHEGISEITMISPESIDFSGLDREGKRELFKQNFSDISENFPIEKVDKIISGLERQRPAGHSVDSNNDGQNDLGVVIVPLESLTKYKIASKLSNMPAEQLSNLPGTNQDWQILSTAH